MKLCPLHDRVILKRIEEEKKTAGGIVIPDTAAEKPSRGEVLYCGPGKTDEHGKLVPGCLPFLVGSGLMFGHLSSLRLRRSSGPARAAPLSARRIVA